MKSHNISIILLFLLCVSCRNDGLSLSIESKNHEISVNLLNNTKKDIVLREDEKLELFPGRYGLQAVVIKNSKEMAKKCAISDSKFASKEVTVKSNEYFTEVYTEKYIAHQFCLMPGAYRVYFVLNQDKITLKSNEIALNVE